MDSAIQEYIDIFRETVKQIEEAKKAYYEAIAECKSQALGTFEYAIDYDDEISELAGIQLASILYFEFDGLIRVSDLEATIQYESLKGKGSFKDFMAKHYIGIPAVCMDCGTTGYTSPKKRESYNKTIERTQVNGLCSSCRAKREEQEKQKSLIEAEERTRNKELLRTMPYAEYLKTDHWVSMRKYMLKKAHYKCQLCGNKQELHVHHRTYENRGNELPQDLIVLCASCHRKFHNIPESEE